MVKIEVTMTRKALFKYFLGFTYKSFSGIVGLLAGILIVVLGCVNAAKGAENAILYIIIGAVLVCFTPAMLWKNSGKQLKKNFAKPLVYTLEDTRILVEMGEDQAEYDWKDMQKVTASMGNILVYTGYRNAFILPKACIGEQYEAMVAQFKKCMDEKKVKIK